MILVPLGTPVPVTLIPWAMLPFSDPVVRISVDVPAVDAVLTVAVFMPLVFSVVLDELSKPTAKLLEKNVAILGMAV